MYDETDKRRAVIGSVLLHGLLALVIVISARWHSPPKKVSVAGPIIEATLVIATPSKSAARAAEPTPPPPTPPEPKPPEPVVEPELAAPLPQPEPEPVPQEAPAPPQPTPQQQIPDPAEVEQERASRLAQQQAEIAEKEAEEKRRQEQILLEQAREEEAERRERLARQQKEREEQLADIRRQREAAEQRRRNEEERLRELEDERETREAEAPPAAEEPAGNEGVDPELLGRYALAIQRAVVSNWLRPESADAGIRCSLAIVQIPGGEVISVDVIEPCNADPLTRRSIEAAVLKAAPLPYAGFEDVFDRNLRFNFRYDG